MSALTNAISILRKVREEYPKNPAKAELVTLIDPSLTGEERFAPDNICMCLLGHVGVAGGLEPRAMTNERLVSSGEFDHVPYAVDTVDGPSSFYGSLHDGNGIDMAVRLLAVAIRPDRPLDLVSVFSAHTVVYNFNDKALVPMWSGAYSESSVAMVLDKIDEAIALGEKKLQA